MQAGYVGEDVESILYKLLVVRFLFTLSHSIFSLLPCPQLTALPYVIIFQLKGTGICQVVVKLDRHVLDIYVCETNLFVAGWIRHHRQQSSMPSRVSFILMKWTRLQRRYACLLQRELYFVLG